MINLSLGELELIAQSRNISDYESKSKEYLTKALRESEPKPKPKTKPETKPKPEPKLVPKPEPEPKVEIKVNRKKLKKPRKAFEELRHKFSNKDEIREYKKAFYDAKKYKVSEPKIKKLK